MKKVLLLLLCAASQFMIAQNTPIQKLIDEKANAIEAQLIKWRRHFHQNPELSNREFNTMKYIADNIQGLGLDIKTGAAKTGVIAVLDTKKPGPVIGLRADIDALPVKERANLPFKSEAIGEYDGNKVPVMHACGHDSHTAILMATAHVLSGMKDKLTGKVVFVFQPAEEGAPKGEEGGAKLLIKEGLMKTYGIEVMFGLHIGAGLDANKINYKAGGTMAASDVFEITVKGKQSHGSKPWGGVDPIVTSALIINGLQTIISRQTELTKEAAVITVGKIEGGVRNNIIPEECKMVGTIRTLDTGMQRLIHEKIVTTAINIAESQGAKAEVTITKGYPVTYNDPALTAKVIDVLERVAGEPNVRVTVASTGAEDFSFYALEVPSVFFFLGGKDPKSDNVLVQQHHTPDFYIDESGFKLGLRAFCNLIVDYPSMKKETRP
jgi:amidohydrolase